MIMNSIPAFYFDTEELEKLSRQYSDSFKNAKPFPHTVIDDFLPQEILSCLIKEFPTPESIEWTMHGPGKTSRTHDKCIDKLGASEENKFGLFTRHFMSHLNSSTFIQFIEDLTGASNIIPDPSYNACGLHSTGPGGKLMIHTDVNRHRIKDHFHQCYNLIFFLNENWAEEYGGHLELWSRDKKRCEKRVLPKANRAVIFDTGAYSFHGHPHKLTCPPDRRRNSLAVYYYVPDRKSDENYRGFQNTVDWIPTTKEDKIFYFKSLPMKIIRKITPPILMDLLKRGKTSLAKLRK